MQETNTLTSNFLPNSQSGSESADHEPKAAGITSCSGRDLKRLCRGSCSPTLRQDSQSNTGTLFTKRVKSEREGGGGQNLLSVSLLSHTRGRERSHSCSSHHFNLVDYGRWKESSNTLKNTCSTT